MMREVRWILQTSKPGHDDWYTQEDRVYSGWFYSTGEDKPSETVLAEYEEAAKELDRLDVRLVQETRSRTQVVLKEIRREVEDDGTT